MLREISLLWSMLHTLVLFFLLFESRYSKRKTFIITIATMLPLTVANIILAFNMDASKMGMTLLLTLSLPSLIIFLILAKHRDGRFFFTFCLVDTVVLEIIYLTQAIDRYTTPDTHLVMLITRLIIFPLIDLYVFAKLRKVYLDVQNNNKQGWTLYSLIGFLSYILITVAYNYPSAATERPEYLPVILLIYILIPVIYVDIIRTLHRLQVAQETDRQKSLLNMQVSNLTSRMEELAEADEKFRVERHNFRHKLKTITSLLETEQYEECLLLLSEYSESLEKTKVRRYCKNSVLDAVFSTYIRKAESKEIKVTYGLAFPDILPVDETELATAIANALENAINACETLERPLRYIDIKALDRPGFMIQIANSYCGELEFDEDGIPVNNEDEHGFGTRFIAAFCNKNNGYYQFKADGKRFTLYLNF